MGVIVMEDMDWVVNGGRWRLYCARRNERPTLRLVRNVWSRIDPWPPEDIVVGFVGDGCDCDCDCD